MKVFLHQGDLPESLEWSDSIAVDTETMGLQHQRDPLCLVQLSAGNGEAHIVQLDRKRYEAPRLKALLSDQNIQKIFHFARFDIGVIRHYLHVWVEPVYCTKIASKLVRTYTDSHGLKDLCQELLNKKISKQQQSSDWGSEHLSEAQLDYAASDVLYLHKIQEKLNDMLQRESKKELAEECFSCLKTRVKLDLAGFGAHDIFSHASNG